MAYGLIPALTLQSGITKQIHSGQGYLGVGDGIDTSTAEALQIGVSNASSVVIGGAASYGVVISGAQTFTTGTGNILVNGNILAVNGKNPDLDFSCSDGYFYTSTGANNLNGNVTVTGTNTVTINAFTTAGVVHNNASGLLSTSLIINSDISPTAAIAGTSISPNFGSQNVVTTGSVTSDTLNSGTSTLGSTTVSSLTDSGLGLGVVHSSGAGLFSSSLIVNADITNATIAPTKLVAGSDRQILLTNGSTPTWATVGGDATIADNGNITINSLNGNPLNFGTLGPAQDGYIATWDGYHITFLESTNVPGLTVIMNGDVTGLSNVSHVVAIQGNPVSATAPTAGQFLVENAAATSSAWTSMSGDGTLSASVPGQLTVNSLNGNPLNFGTLGPAQDGYIATWDGYHITFLESTNVPGLTVIMGGDVTGLSNTNTVSNIQGNPVSFGTLGPSQDGYLATWTGTAISFVKPQPSTVTDFGSTPATLGTACYVSANDVALPCDNTVINKSYCAGFVLSSGELIVDGVVTPIINGSAPAGSIMFLDGGANAGKVTATAPTLYGSSVAPVGFMKNATQMVIRVLLPDVN